MKKLVLVLAMAGLCLPAQAQYWKDGPHAGFVGGGDIDDSQFNLGWQAAYEFNDIVSLEGSISGFRDDFSTDELLPDEFESDVDLDVIALTLAGKVGLREKWAYLFISAGAGYYIFNADAENINRTIDDQDLFPRGASDFRASANVDDAIGFRVSAGAEFALSRHWELFAEVGYVFLDADRDLTVTATVPNDVSFSKETITEDDTMSYDHTFVHVGVNYRF